MQALYIARSHAVRGKEAIFFKEQGIRTMTNKHGSNEQNDGNLCENTEEKKTNTSSLESGTTHENARKDEEVASRRLPLRQIIGGLLLLGVGVIILWKVWGMVNDPTDVSSNLPQPPAMEVTVDQQPPLSRKVITNIFETNLTPLIEYANKENEKAKDRAIQAFQNDFGEFHKGIPAFTEDLTGWGTRFGVVSNWTKDKWDAWWNENENANQLGEYVNDKFRQHILSEKKLEQAFIDAITQFTGDLAANRNALLSEMQIVLTSQDLPVQIRLPKDEFKVFSAQIQEHFKDLSIKLSEKSVVVGIGGLVAGFFVEEGARRAATGVAIRVIPAVAASPIITSVMAPVATGVATRLAAMGLTTGGATATFAAAGGTGRTLAGPLGTAVGGGVGFVAGGIADWWMSARFEKKTAEQIGTMLQVMGKQIIEGVGNEDGTSLGLDGTFGEANRQMKRLMREATLTAMWERAGA